MEDEIKKYSNQIWDRAEAASRQERNPSPRQGVMLTINPLIEEIAKLKAEVDELKKANHVNFQ